MKKRIISVILAILIVTALPINIINSFAAEPNKISITDCETLTGWTKTGGNGLTINNNGCGSGSKAVACDIDKGAFRTAKYTAPTAINISRYKNIELDVMMHTGGAAGMWQEVIDNYGDEVYIKIGSSDNDYNIYRLSKMTISPVNELWNHISIDIDNPSSTTGSFDKTKMTVFSFTTIDGAVSANVRNGHIRLDNIIASNLREEQGSQPDGDKVITECESVTDWSYSGNANNYSLNQNGMTGNAIYAYTDFGALRELKYSKEIDLKGYNTIEFDLFCQKKDDTTGFDMLSEIANSYSGSIGIKIYDDSSNFTYKYSNWHITALGNYWYHIAVNIEDGAPASKPDMEKFKAFSVFTNINSDLDRNLSSTFFKIDNIIATNTTPQGGGEEATPGVWKIPGSFSKKTTGTFSFVAESFNYDLSDYAKNELWLCMDITVENTDGSGNVDGLSSEGQIELTSSGQCDKNEGNWQFPRLNLKSGKNSIRLSLSGASYSSDPSKDIDLSSVNYLRIYSKKANDDEFDIKIENLYITCNAEKSILGTYFTDGMMFKQNEEMKLFGYLEESGKPVKAKLFKDTEFLDEKSATSGEGGYWSVSFAARAGSYDKYKIEVYVDGDLTETIENILIGELWLAAGQSNMEFFVLQTIPDYDYDLIPLNEYVRFFDEPLVPGGASSILPSDPARDIPEAKWSDGSAAANVRYVSAIAYYMSLTLQSELNVPIGFINAAKGASGIETWLSRETIDFIDTVKNTLTENGAYRTKEQLDNTESNWNFMTTLYNSKIAPLAGIPISGVLWYQGENNIKYADKDGVNNFYTAALKGLIESYSDLFGFESGKMPFVFAHLAPYNYKSVRGTDYQTILAGFSEALTKAAKTANALVSELPIYDLSLNFKDPPINNPDPIHPNSKREAAARFATAVLSGYYGIGNQDAYTAPTVSDFKVSGEKVILTFKNTGDGLKSLSNSTVHGFAIAGADRVFIPADAQITSKTTVELSAAGISAPVAATYAWDSFNMSANLCNSSDVPAVPYRSDTQKSVYLLSNAWMFCDLELAWDGSANKDIAGYKPAWRVDENGTIAFDNAVMAEGEASLKLSYTEGGAAVSPILNYNGMVKQFESYSGITVAVKNLDAQAKNIAVKISTEAESYLASAITGDKLATAYTLADGYDFNEYTFNFKRLVNAEGKVVIDTTDILKNLTSIEFIINDEAAGTVYLDDIKLRTDKLPTPGSENDDIVEPEKIIVPGTVNEDGSMWMSPAENLSNWTSTSSLSVDNTEKLQGNASVSVNAVGSILRQIVFTSDSPLDISGYDYLEFDAFFSDLSWYDNSTGIMFELTSSGTCDVESNRYMKGSIQKVAPDLYSDALTGAASGKWYHFKLPINEPQAKAKGGLDNTRFNYFRFYTIGSPAGAPDYTLKLDNMLFTKKAAAGQEPEAPQNYDSYGEVNEDGEMYMSTAETVNWWSAKGAKVSLNSSLKTQGETSVAVTAPGGILKEIAFTPTYSIDISGYAYLEFDAYFSNLDWFNASENTLFELTSSGTCDKQSYRFTKSSILESCVQFAEDIEKGTGGNKWYHFKINLKAPHDKPNGGLNLKAFNYFRFYSIGAKVGTPDYTLCLDNMKFVKGEVADKIIITENSLILNNCDSTSGWSATGAEVVVDKNEKVSGKGSVSVVAKNGILKQLAYLPEEPVDISKYNFVEFDLYFSDVSALRTSTNFMVELTSSGKCDYESNRYMKSGILAACPELAKAVSSSEPSPGWYHIKLNLNRPQNQARGGLDLKTFDYFRIYFIGAAEGTPDTTVKIDDLKFTVGSADELAAGNQSGSGFNSGYSKEEAASSSKKFPENPGLHINLVTEETSMLLLVVACALGGLIVLELVSSMILLFRKKKS